MYCFPQIIFSPKKHLVGSKWSIDLKLYFVCSKEKLFCKTWQIPHSGDILILPSNIVTLITCGNVSIKKNILKLFRVTVVFKTIWRAIIYFPSELNNVFINLHEISIILFNYSTEFKDFIFTEGYDCLHRIVDMPNISLDTSFTPEEERQVLIQLYHSTSGHQWCNNTGWLNSSVHHCSWNGVTCYENAHYVKSIQLAFNNLNGSLPDNLWKLRNLLALCPTANPLLGGQFFRVCSFEHDEAYNTRHITNKLHWTDPKRNYQACSYSELVCLWHGWWRTKWYFARRSWKYVWVEISGDWWKQIWRKRTNEYNQSFEIMLYRLTKYPRTIIRQRKCVTIPQIYHQHICFWADA